MAEVRKDVHFRFFLFRPDDDNTRRSDMGNKNALSVHFRHYNQRPKQRILHFFFFAVNSKVVVETNASLDHTKPRVVNLCIKKHL